MSNREIWVLAEKAGTLAELIAGGRGLGEKVVALVVGPRVAAETAIEQGADEALWLGDSGPSRLFEDYADTVFGLLVDRRPLALLVQASRRGKLMAGRLGASLGTSVLPDVRELAVTDGRLVATHMVLGGGAVRVEKSTSEIALATVGSGVYKPNAVDPDRRGEVVEVPFKGPAWTVTVVDRRSRGASNVNLPAATRVVGAGRGIAKKDDLAMVAELAGLLKAEVACSRPLAEGVDWLPRERYLGVSGAVIKPDLYLAVGISGQVQHTIGVSEAKIIAAINRDKAAPIFAQADYGIVGDLYKVVPALIAALKASK